MITVIGKLADTTEYIDREGYNVLSKFDGWTPEFNREWLRQAVERGDQILIVSTQNVTGQFRNELLDLINLLTVCEDRNCHNCVHWNNGECVPECPVCSEWLSEEEFLEKRFTKLVIRI